MLVILYFACGNHPYLSYERSYILPAPMVKQIRSRTSWSSFRTSISNSGRTSYPLYQSFMFSNTYRERTFTIDESHNIVRIQFFLLNLFLPIRFLQFEIASAVLIGPQFFPSGTTNSADFLHSILRRLLVSYLKVIIPRGLCKISHGNRYTVYIYLDVTTR